MRYKRSKYAARGIPEYRMVGHPGKGWDTLLILVDGFYEQTRFSAEQPIASSFLLQFALTALQVLNAGHIS